MHQLSRQRKLYMEACAGAGPAFHFDGSTMLAHDAISDRKPQARSLAGGLGGEERIVDSRKMLGSDSLPAVGNLDAGEPVLAPGLDGQRAARFHGVPRVQEEIQENL